MKKILLIIVILNFNILIANIDPMTVYKQQLEFCELLKDPEAISACKNNILLIAAQNLSNSNQNQINRPNKKNRKNKQKNFNKPEQTIDEINTKEFLINLANIFGNIGKIAIDKQNPSAMGQNICNIIANMINMAASITRNISIDENEESNNLNQVS